MVSYCGSFQRNGRRIYYWRLWLVSRNNHEKRVGIPDDLKRICCWIKFDAGKVARIEIPSKCADYKNNLERANEIVSLIYKFSKMNGGKLPIFFQRADNSAMIKENEVRNYSALLDEYLKKLKLPYGNQDYWK